MVSIEDQFKYHPPVSLERQIKHDLVNKAALAFALEIEQIIPYSDPLHDTIINSIQQARMFANQSITYQELREEMDKKVLETKKLQEERESQDMRSRLYVNQPPNTV